MNNLKFIQNLDNRFYSLIRKLSFSPGTLRLWTFFVRVGDGYIWILPLIALIYYYPLQWKSNLLRILLTSLFSLTLYLIIKNGLKRPRPFVMDQTILAEVPPVDKYSFPSGHVMNNLATSLACFLYLPKLAIIISSFSVIWAFSRVYFGVHYFTDVMGGIVLAVLCFAISIYFQTQFFPY